MSTKLHTTSAQHAYLHTHMQYHHRDTNEVARNTNISPQLTLPIAFGHLMLGDSKGPWTAQGYSNMGPTWVPAAASSASVSPTCTHGFAEGTMGTESFELCWERNEELDNLFKLLGCDFSSLFALTWGAAPSTPVPRAGSGPQMTKQLVKQDISERSVSAASLCVRHFSLPSSLINSLASERRGHESV